MVDDEADIAAFANYSESAEAPVTEAAPAQ
jgi:hypothetical protein